MDTEITGLCANGCMHFDKKKQDCKVKEDLGDLKEIVKRETWPGLFERKHRNHCFNCGKYMRNRL